MPIIDAETGALVIRLVYDGPPLSGKTTSLRALAQGLGVTVTSPAEQEGRTLFFDWMEYSGGLFDGRRIRCQLISVPGQAALRNRRQLILESADAIVMVANTRSAGIGPAAALIAELNVWAQEQSPPIGLVVQANQRDAPDSVSKRELRDRLCGDLPIAIVETVASRGEGVREAFVFGVRLALDRARDLSDRGKLLTSRGVGTSATLLTSLEELERDLVSQRPDEHACRAVDAELGGALEPEPSIAAREPMEAPSSREAPSSSRAEFIADPSMPGGFIWPPVHGRAFLHEVAGLALALNRSSRGDWSASGEGWRVHSAAHCEFESTDAGRPVLIDWARVHAANGRKLSEGRVVILSPWSRNTQRLWQLVKIHQSLREALSAAVERLPAGALAEAFFDAAAHLHRARLLLNDQDLSVPCSLWTVSAELDRPPVYLGLMPDPGAGAREEPDGEGLIEREFTPLLRSVVREREDGASVIEQILSRSGPHAKGERAWVRRLVAENVNAWISGGSAAARH